MTACRDERVPDERVPDDPVLDNPAYAALTSIHRDVALRRGRAVRYRTDVSPFGALPPDPSPADWRDLAAIAAPAVALLDVGAVPPGWLVRDRLAVLQMLLPATPDGGPAAEVERLTRSDVPDMLALVAATHPGPFARRTIDLGCYLGVRDQGRLVAMAGERLRPPGWTEVSAVCTAPGYQGRGLGRRLLHEVVRGIRARGEQPFLHVMADNRAAIALYEHLGATTRRAITVTVLSPT